MRFLRKALTVLVTGALAILAVVALATWWRYPKRSVDSVFVRAEAGAFTFADVPKGRQLSPQEIEVYARRLLTGMSLEQKVLQMSGDTWLWDFIGERYVGRSWKAGADKKVGLPRIVSSDGPRGVGLESSTCFPVPMARGASWDRDLERRIGDVTGKEMRGHGANLWLAPCLNLLRHPLWGRAQETYGEDPYLLGEMAAALTEGAQRHNVMACAKHYALNSIEKTRRQVDVRVGERALREVYLPHFKRVIDAGVASVMSGYNKVNGDYCGENRHLLREILKDEWGFQGFVVSDWFDAVTDGPKAAQAGLDLEMPMVDAFGKKLTEAVGRGQVAPAIVDDAVLRLLRRRIEYATRPDPMAYDAGLVRAAQHVAFTREVAEKSIVLLENNDGLLPLDRSLIKTLAVIGPLADADNIGDHGSSRVRPANVVTPLEGLRADLGTAVRVVHELGADLAKARAAARTADVAIVVVGFTHLDEGEYIPFFTTPRADRGGDRKDLALKGSDRALVEAVAEENTRSVVVLIGGAAVAVEEWKDRAGAILMAFYPGEQGGAALARVLFGDVNPSGKLPFTVPKDAFQLPAFDNRSLSVEYGYYHGYTLAEKKGFEPTYPFGYGQSYTTYRYANLTVEPSEVREDGEIRASVDVTNTGWRAGDEVVQLYVGFTGSKVDRPVKLLRGFEKVGLGPGESKRVALTVNAKNLAYYDPDARRWVVERMEHQVLVGPSSRATELLSAGVTIVD
jgi:beta-glucosidase